MFGKNAWEIFEQKHGHEALLEKKREYSKKFKGENNPFFGKRHTEETKKKLSEIMKNSENHKKRCASIEYRKRLSESLKKSEEINNKYVYMISYVVPLYIDDAEKSIKEFGHITIDDFRKERTEAYDYIKAAINGKETVVK